MAKDNNDILLIGGIAIAAFFLLSKKKTSSGNTSMYYPGGSPYPSSNSYGYSPNTGNIITSTGSAISDIINAIKGKNTAVIQPAPDGFDYDQWSKDVSNNPQYWDSWFGSNYENYA